MLATGQRAGEVTSIEWSEIDFNTNLWVIPADKSKNGRPHTVPLTALSLELLLKAKIISSNKKLAFPSPQNLKSAKPIEVRTLSRSVTRKFDILGVQKFVPHDLRRTVRTKLAELGVDEIVSERILNNQLQGLARVYNHHNYLPQMREALSLWEEYLLEITSSN